MVLTVGIAQVVELPQLFHILFQPADRSGGAGTYHVYPALLPEQFQFIALPVVSGVAAGNGLGQSRGTFVETPGQPGGPVALLFAEVQLRNVKR